MPRKTKGLHTREREKEEGRQQEQGGEGPRRLLERLIGSWQDLGNNGQYYRISWAANGQSGLTVETTRSDGVVREI